MVLGKSTLAKLIAGIIKPTNGEITIDDLDTKKDKNFLNLRKKIGIVFQNPENQIVFNNAYDDMAFMLKNLKEDNIDEKIKSALNKVKMSEHINSNLFDLSLGQKQRITLAEMLSIHPKYIVFDEPTTMLDAEGKQDVYDIISHLKGKGYTIIYITNVVDEILMADRIIILNSGEINCIINKSDILDNTDKFKHNGIKLPTIVKMLKTFKDNGINIPLKNWDFSELTEKIIGEIKNEKHN